MFVDGSSLRPKKRLTIAAPAYYEASMEKFEILMNVWRQTKLKLQVVQSPRGSRAGCLMDAQTCKQKLELLLCVRWDMCLSAKMDPVRKNDSHSTQQSNIREGGKTNTNNEPTSSPNSGCASEPLQIASESSDPAGWRRVVALQVPASFALKDKLQSCSLSPKGQRTNGRGKGLSAKHTEVKKGRPTQLREGAVLSMFSGECP